MSFNDDSHILSQLGILASRDESPRNIRYSSSKTKTSTGKDLFVDVNIEGSAELKSESDEEEPVFDKNSLLPPSTDAKVYRKGAETYVCMYVILLLTYFAMGVWCTLSQLVTPFSNKLFPNSLFENNTGLVVGSVAGKLLCKRMSITFLSLLCTTLVCILSWIISDFSKVVDVRISSFLLGFASGCLLYGGLATWFIFWRGYNRKGLFLYLILTLGSLLISAVHDPAFNSGELKFMRSPITPHKRAAGSTLRNENLTEHGTLDGATTVKLRKPQVVQGIQSTETKSEQNQQMRKTVAYNNTRISNVSSVGMRNNSHANVPVDIRQSSNSEGFISPVSNVSNTERASLTKTIDFDQSSFSLTKSEISTTNISLKEVSVEERLMNIITTTIVAVYFMAFVCCCIPFTIKSDLKFAKLFDPTIAGLTRGCRVRLVAVQMIASFLESLVELAAIVLSSQKNTYNMNILHHVVVAVSRTFIIISGPCAYSFFGCCLALTCSSLGSVLLLFPFFDPFSCHFLMSMGTGVFGLLLFFHVEARVYPRSGTQLDYYIFPSVVGRFLSAVLCTLLHPRNGNEIIFAILLSSALLVVAFMLLTKSVSKAARLKEIMEYSSSPALDAYGEYVSLIEKDIGFDSVEEDNRDEVIAN